MKKMLQSAFVLLIVFSSCKKGDTGPAGADGIDGNANVIQYTFGAQNLTSGYSQLLISTTRDTMDNSTWLVYLYYEPLARWYFVPGGGTGGSTLYRVSIGYLNNKVNIFIDKTGPGENYSQCKVVRIYNSATLPGGRRAYPVDVTDYEAVRRYYHLP